MATTITVVTPSFNQARFLDETLRSVLCQRDQIHEYFVLDGGSTDGSQQIIENYSPLIDYWVSRKDKGQSDAIHQGFQRATGDVLCWLNSDDLFLPGALRQVREAFDRHPEWDVLTSYHVQVDADSRIIGVYYIPGEWPMAARWGVLHVAQQTCFFRRRVYEAIGGLDLSLHCVMDTDLWSRMLLAGTRWGHLPVFLAAFRQHAAAKGSSWLKEYAQERELLRQRYPVNRAGNWSRFVGLGCYRISQIVTGRRLRSMLLTRRHRGRRINDVFGDWIMSPMEATTNR